MSMLHKLKRLPKSIYDHGKFEIYKRDGSGNQTIKLRDALDNAVKMRCQNVADYFWAQTQEHWALRRDFPNVAPSWPLAWFDWHRPTYRHEGNLIPGGDCGALLMSVESPTQPISFITGEPQRWSFLWLMAYELAGSLNLARYQFYVSSEGLVIPDAVVENAACEINAVMVHPKIDYAPAKKARLECGLIELSIPLLALTLANCSNTEVISESSKNTRPHRIIKHRNDDHEPVTWHVLEIKKTKRLLEDAASPARLRSGESLLRQRLHIARGHFKDFKSGKGLFGKHHGLYWWDQQCRGFAESGAIKKAYDIAAPAPSTK